MFLRVLLQELLIFDLFLSRTNLYQHRFAAATTGYLTEKTAENDLFRGFFRPVKTLSFKMLYIRFLRDREQALRPKCIAKRKVTYA